VTTKRMILGKLSEGAEASGLQQRGVALASALLADNDVTRAVYNETLAPGPRGDSFGFDLIIEAWVNAPKSSPDADRVRAVARETGLDLHRSRIVDMEEIVFKPGSAAVKGTFLSKRRPGSSVPEYQAYWCTRHAEIIMAQTDFFAYVRAYVQNHFVSGTFRSLAGQVIDGDDLFDGSPQMWFDSPEDIYRAFKTDGYLRHIKEDEKILVKVGFSQSYVAQEHPIELASLRG